MEYLATFCPQCLSDSDHKPGQCKDNLIKRLALALSRIEAENDWGWRERRAAMAGVRELLVECGLRPVGCRTIG